MRMLCVIMLVLVFFSCTSQSDALRALKAEGGYTDITFEGGYGWFACSGDDWYATEFCATNKEGKRVCGTVCSGLFFKSATIRW